MPDLILYCSVERGVMIEDEPEDYYDIEMRQVNGSWYDPRFFPEGLCQPVVPGRIQINPSPA
jgi:hypothetical protein